MYKTSVSRAVTIAAFAVWTIALISVLAGCVRDEDYPPDNIGFGNTGGGNTGFGNIGN